MSCDKLKEQYETLKAEHAQLQDRYNTMRTVATIHNHQREALEMNVNALVCLTQPAFCDSLISDGMIREPVNDGERIIDERLAARNDEMIECSKINQWKLFTRVWRTPDTNETEAHGNTCQT